VQWLCEPWSSGFELNTFFQNLFAFTIRLVSQYRELASLQVFANGLKLLPTSISSID